MSASANKALMQRIFEGLAEGDASLFRASLAEDFTWTLLGTTAWSRTYRGRRAVVDELLKPLFAKFADTYTAVASRFIAEDDHVVVEYRGHVTTKSGRPYHNTYCWVCRLADGKLVELTEYMDTELVTAALGTPGA